MKKLIVAIFIISNLSMSFAEEQAFDELIINDIHQASSIIDAAVMASGNIITVGGDPNGCHFDSIQEAIDTIPPTSTGQIHIATNRTYIENLTINNISVSLIGGFEDCVAAGSPFIQPRETQVLIEADTETPVLTIVGDTQRHIISLQNLRLIDGVGVAPNSESTGGGILAFQSSAQVLLNNVDVRGNEAQYGGGISIIDGDTDMLLENSRVINNSANFGGGIYCSGLFSSVMLTEQSGVVANVATGVPVSNSDPQGRAGGLYINGCQFSMYTGAENDSMVGIVSNIAFGNGGGIYADDSASLIINGHQSCSNFSCLGDDNTPANVTNNMAGFTQTFGLGGGIYIEGSTTNLNIFAGLIEGNMATHGGGIYVDDSNLNVQRLKRRCWDKDRCNFFKNNQATVGGAVTNVTGDVSIQHSYFEDNTATHGAATSSIGTAASRHETSLKNNVFNNNGDDSSMSIFIVQQSASRGSFRLTSSTVADNTLASIAAGASVINFDGLGGLAIEGSIVFNLGTQVLKHSNTLNPSAFIQCIIANEVDSLDVIDNTVVSHPQISQGLPGFVDNEGRDYHLSDESTAIDSCLNFFPVAVDSKDIDFEPREYNDPNINPIPNESLDIGADEYLISDIIFDDDFE